jgi:hypothetical protein
MHINRFLCSTGLAICAALPIAVAHAETTLCTPIVSLPAVITTQGVYCLNSDLATAMASGNAIDIQTNNVTIDLNGHKLGGQAAGLGTMAYGIYSLNRNNITIRNGTIRGFSYAIMLSDDSVDYGGTGGHLISEIRADANTMMGIMTRGKGNIIRNNQVVNTGGSTKSPSVWGIHVAGPGVRISKNDVISTNITGQSYTARGISIFRGNGGIIENNTVTDTTSNGGGAYGIETDSSDAVAISGNRISNDTASALTLGINVYPGNNANVRDNSISNMATGITLASPTDKYMGNMVNGATTAYSGGTAGIGNM